jgi:uncharacterized protein involved in exopolysaccharide biosynthesis
VVRGWRDAQQQGKALSQEVGDNSVESAQPPSSPEPGDSAVIAADEISLVDLWKVLVRGRKIIFYSIALTTLAALMYALLATPVYRAELLMVSAEDSNTETGGMSLLSGQLGGLASLAGFNLGEDNTNSRTALAVLESRRFTREFIEAEDLMPVLFADQWDSQTKEWKQPTLISRIFRGVKGIFSMRDEYYEPDNYAPTAWDAYRLVDDEILSISSDDVTGLITVSIEWQDPRLAAEWANNAVARLNDDMRNQAVAEAEESIRFLKKRLEQTTPVGIEQAFYGLIEAQTKTVMLANVRDEYSFKVIDPAVVPEDPVRPQRLLSVVLGIFLGAVIGIFITVFWFLILEQSRSGR